MSEQQIWFLTGSQGLYGPETLAQVEDQSRKIVDQLNITGEPPLPVVWQPLLTDADAIHRLVLQANADPDCLGVITWMPGLTRSFQSRMPFGLPLRTRNTIVEV